MKALRTRKDSLRTALFAPLASLFLVAAGGCYQADLPSGQFKCDQPGDACPSGMRCLSGLCIVPKDENTPVAADMSAPAVTPPSPSLACTGTGRLLASIDLPGGKTQQVIACVAAWSAGSASKQCRAGFHVCGATGSDATALAAISANGRCDPPGLDGFFAANVPAGAAATGELLCQPAAGSAARSGLAGCGSETDAGGGSIATALFKQPCTGLLSFAACSGATETVRGFTCTSGLADSAHTSTTRGGVLCCTDTM